ncbi:MAG: RNA pseudouridine synthase [Saprospiraceae bacterium]|nr:RNA pseudouridine synthase [Saprospiraceae bacterium]
MLKKNILFEDNHLLIINKQAGILSQGDQTGDDSVIEIYKQYIKVRDKKPGNVFLGLPHRLDRPVSGALVLCKTSKALTRMTKQIKEREIQKVYHAVINEKIYSEPKRLVSYLKKDTRLNKAIVSDKPFKHAKEAVLSFEVISIVDNFTLMEIHLETGRPHQIRAQLAYHKMAIYGDTKYSNKKPLRDKTIALHSRRVSLSHPVGGERVEVTAPYPDKTWWQYFK